MYLTKSKFKLARECQRKLYYACSPGYTDDSHDDDFLKALAENGRLIEEIARMKYPGGKHVADGTIREQIAATKKLLGDDSNKDIVIFEAAFESQNLFARVDILERKDGEIKIIEVKSKSCSGSHPAQFMKKDGKIKSKWKPYIEDVIFQQEVVQRSLGVLRVEPRLMLVNKDAGERRDGTADQDYLVEVDVPSINDIFYLDNLVGQINDLETFHLPYERGSVCKGCQFRPALTTLGEGEKSGFEECWNVAGEATILEVWNTRKIDEWYANGKRFLTDLVRSDITEEWGDRQWLQISCAVRGDDSCEFASEVFGAKKDSWQYPLHFIDFETCTPSIPFHNACRPFEVVAFQFSHHTIDENGDVSHVGQYIDLDNGQSPNFDFVRALRAQLSSDDGTIFRYANHENTVLRQIRAQLELTHPHVDDHAELLEFIDSVTRETKKEGGKKGERCMVDMCELIKDVFYSPEMRGSNSIKSVLPSVLNVSEFLKEKYSRPVYGVEGKISSNNFENKTWVETCDGRVVDPYRKLIPIPNVFEGVSNDRLVELDEKREMLLNNGGLASAVYSKLQQGDKAAENARDDIEKALLQYCELDTLAMVMIIEGLISLEQSCEI